MTCIVAYERDGCVWMGGDSAGVDYYSISARGDEKVFKNGEYIMGFTTSFRMGQLLRYKLKPTPCTDWDLEKHMATTFIDEVRECFSANGYVRKSEAGEDVGGRFLVATHGRIFMVDNDFQVGWNRAPFNAVGCGADIALGAMHAAHNIGVGTPQDIVHAGLSAAAEFSAGVCAPFTFHTLDR